MTGNISLTEYNELVENLDFLSPFEKCCESGEMEVVIVEPLDGRNMLGVNQDTQFRCALLPDGYAERYAQGEI